MSSSSDIDTDSIPSLQTISDSSPSPDNVDAPCPRGYKRDEHGQLVVDPESLEVRHSTRRPALYRPPPQGEVRYIRPLCNVIVTKLHTAMSSISAPGNKYPIASIPPGIRWSLVMPEAIQRAVPCSGDLCGTRVTSLLSYGGETITFTLGARLISAHFVDDTGKTRSYLKLYLDPLRVVDLDALHNLILEVADDYKHGEPTTRVAGSIFAQYFLSSARRLRGDEHSATCPRAKCSFGGVFILD